MNIRTKIGIAFLVFCGVLVAILQSSFGSLIEAQKLEDAAREASQERSLVLETAWHSGRYLAGADTDGPVRQRLAMLEALARRPVDAGLADREFVDAFISATHDLLDVSTQRATAIEVANEGFTAWTAVDQRLADPALQHSVLAWREQLTRFLRAGDDEERRQAGERLQQHRLAIATRLEDLTPSGVPAVTDAKLRFRQLDTAVEEAIRKTARLAAAVIASDRQVQKCAVASPEADATTLIAELGTIQLRLGVAVAVVFGALVSIVWMLVMVPLRRTSRLLRSIAEGETDLTQRLDEEHHDEVGDFAHWFNVFVARIQQMVRSLGHVTIDLAATSRDLAGISVELSDASRGNAEQARRLASSAHAVDSDVQHAAKGVGDLGTQYERVNGSSHRAASFSTDAVGVSQSVRDAVSRLSEASNEVSELIALISSIARQTDLLAINAAIEAARAGTAGQGFAVVAEEVRRLANDTTHGADSVTEQLGSIHVDSETAVVAVAKVTDVVERVQQLQAEIADIVEGQTSLTQTVLTRMESAASGSREIQGASATVASATEGTVELARDTERSSKKLEKLADNLGELVALFRC